MNIRQLHLVSDTQIQALAEVLIDCVQGGASVSFMLPITREKAMAFWRGVAEGVSRGERALLVAEDAQDTIVGTVQLILAQPENQPHRADVAKMLVHRRARQQGIAARLMQAVDTIATTAGKTLLVLDTASAEAMRVYERCGWHRAGVVPSYALLPQGGLCDTVFFYKQLTNTTAAT
jgi:GNAT superfamily N-acetyltransferase